MKPAMVAPEAGRPRARRLLLLCGLSLLPSAVDALKIGKVKDLPETDMGSLTRAARLPKEDRMREHKIPVPTLNTVYSVECLTLKQRYGADYVCGNQPTTTPAAATTDECGGCVQAAAAPPAVMPLYLNVGSYPNWRNPACNSDGEFFCDPENLLTHPQQKSVALDLFKQRSSFKVKCGELESKLSGNEVTHLRDFYLGVAIAYDWPYTETDPASLQRFGQVLMGQWHVNPWHNGVDSGFGEMGEAVSYDEYMTNCPAAAMLIILPKHRLAYLSSPSCQFICMDRGGQEVVSAVMGVMETGRTTSSGSLDPAALEAAAKAGIEAVQRVVTKTVPLSHLALNNSKLTKGDFIRKERQYLQSEEFLQIFQAGVMAFVGVACVLGILSFIYFQVWLGEETKLRP